MNTPATHHETLAVRQTQHLAPSPHAAELLAIGREHLWQFRVLGQAPMLQESVRLRDWLLVPAQQDSMPIPARAMARIAAIFAAGTRPQGFVLVHEAPMQLKAPAEAQPKPEATAMPTDAAAGGPAAVQLLAAVGNGLAALVTAILPMFFVVAAAMVDPILVAVTEDGYWIEIDRWQAV